MMNPMQIQVIGCAVDGFDDSIQKTLTTRFVFDWRLKPFKTGEGQEVMRWMRRARLVAREYAFAEGKRDDVFSPASSSHLLRLLPVLLGCLDIKDAFLQVTQQTFEAQNAWRRVYRLSQHSGPASGCTCMVRPHQQLPQGKFGV